MNVMSITGRLTGDPTRRETPKGVVATFRIGSDATPRLWIDVECWGHLAGSCAPHLRRGRHVAITGALAHGDWHDRAGQRQERWYVRAAHVTFLDAPPTERDNQTNSDGAHTDRATEVPTVGLSRPQ